jgi:hypothetical protein
VRLPTHHRNALVRNITAHFLINLFQLEAFTRDYVGDRQVAFVNSRYFA